MSKHRRKDRRNMGNNHQNMGNRNPMMNNPFGIDPKQLLGMLGGNMDMGRLNNMISSMNREGFDLNSISQMMGINNGTSPNNVNYNNQQSNLNNQQMGGAGFNFNNFMNMMNGMGNNSNMNNNFGAANINKDINDNIDEISENDSNNINDTDSNINNIDVDIKKRSHKKNRNVEEFKNIDENEDENIQMLRSVRNIVDFKKAEFIDKVIVAYLNGDFKDN